MIICIETNYRVAWLSKKTNVMRYSHSKNCVWQNLISNHGHGHGHGTFILAFKRQTTGKMLRSVVCMAKSNAEQQLCYIHGHGHGHGLFNMSQRINIAI